MKDSYQKRQDEFKKKVDKQNRQIIGLIINIAVSMTVTILVYFLLTN